MKGDIFTFVEEVEGLDFKEALKLLADKAGVEIKYESGGDNSRQESDKLFEIIETATVFFENCLGEVGPAYDYLISRGLTPESIKKWRLGYAPKEWRALYEHLIGLGFTKEIILKAGLAKIGAEMGGRDPYDVFRDRVIFPLADQSGRIIAFSGRALEKESIPKYLNSPDTPLFSKHEVLYGLDKAKLAIRKQNYAVLVEGQMDLVLSHQAGVVNTVASSGTAFTQGHLERLKHLSRRLILAFDGDTAGVTAAEKASFLGIALGFEIKVANIPEGLDPAAIAEVNPTNWREILRKAQPAPEFFLLRIIATEGDGRKVGKEIVRKILPMIKLLQSTIEQSHFISMIAKQTGIKEMVLWEDLKKAKLVAEPSVEKAVEDKVERIERRSRSDEHKEVIEFLKENPSDKKLLAEKEELERLMRVDELDEKIEALLTKSQGGEEDVLKEIDMLTRERDEVRRKLL